MKEPVSCLTRIGLIGLFVASCSTRAVYAIPSSYQADLRSDHARRRPLTAPARRDLPKLGYRVLTSARSKAEILNHYRRVRTATVFPTEFHSKHGDLLCLLVDTGSGLTILGGYVYIHSGGRWQLAWAKALDSEWASFQLTRQDENLEIRVPTPQTKDPRRRQDRVLFSFEIRKLAERARAR